GTTNGVAFLLGLGMYSSFILVPQLVETPAGHGYGFAATVTEAGLFLLPATVAILLAGSLTGLLEKRFGSKPPLLAGAVLSFAAFALLAVTHDAKWQIDVAMQPLRCVIGLACAAMASLIIENVGPAETGIATGMNTVTRTVGGAFGGAAVASILARTVPPGGGFPTEHAYVEAFAACAFALLAGVLVGFAIPQRRPEAAFAPHTAG